MAVRRGIWLAMPPIHRLYEYHSSASQTEMCLASGTTYVRIHDVDRVAVPEGRI